LYNVDDTQIGVAMQTEENIRKLSDRLNTLIDQMGEAMYNEKMTLDEYDRKWGSFGHPLLLALEWVLDDQDEDADTFTPIAEYIRALQAGSL